eukprot:884052-Rhodomonas_salina.1
MVIQKDTEWRMQRDGEFVGAVFFCVGDAESVGGDTAAWVVCQYRAWHSKCVHISLGRVCR